MKLRIHDNSIRLRLTRSEVASFAAKGEIETTLRFGSDPSQRITYGLKVVPGIAAIGLSGSVDGLVISLPAAIAQEWTGTERIAIAGQQSMDGHGQLEILIEKEFRRLHGAKYNPDLYPNPLESTLAEHRA